MNGRTYNDTTIDALARRTFDAAMKECQTLIGSGRYDPEHLHGLAAVADAAACGFKDEADAEPDVPFATSPHNDDLLNERARAVIFLAMDMARRMIDGNDVMNPDKMQALGATANAAANAFKDEDEDYGD